MSLKQQIFLVLHGRGCLLLLSRTEFVTLQSSKTLPPRNTDTVYDENFALQSTFSTFKAQLEAFSDCERLTESDHRSQISIQAVLTPEIESNGETEMLSVEGIIESLPPGDAP